MRRSYATRSFLKSEPDTGKVGKQVCKHPLVHLVGVDLSRISDVGIVQKVLDTKYELFVSYILDGEFPADLFDSDTWFPRFLLVQDGQTNGARWIHIRVEQRRVEFA